MADLHGVLESLTERTIGDTVAVAASSGASVLSLNDVSDFDEAGGWLTINGTVYAYSTVDMDADTLTLVATLSSGVAVGDQVNLWDINNGVIVTESTALVTLDGQGDGDPILATIDHALAPLLGQGTFIEGQSVSMALDGDEHRVTAVHGKSNPGIVVSRAVTLYSGSGVPSFSANQGDIYFRQDTPTTANQRIYINTALGSSWTGIA